VNLPPAISKLTVGDVLRYLPERHHCREGTAFVTERGDAVDTYWSTTYSYGGADDHRLTAEELATAEVQFNVNDYDALDPYAGTSRPTWETYHPDDRGRISSQHGLQEELFVRRGAAPDLETQIANARAAVETAESNLWSAECRLAQCREDLARLEAQRG
jgi:hypothetical protein